MSSLPPCVKLTGGKRGAPGPLIVTTSDEDSASDGETLPQASPRVPHTTRPNPRNIQTHPSLKLDLSQRPGEGFRARVSSPSPSPSPSHQQQAYDGYEHDHDYENVASPSGSSTASGPVYVRPPGFQHHAQEIRRKKKKSTAGLLTLREGLKKRAPTPPKIRPKREPLPMRLRALPQSFWKQPNVPNAVSPGNMFSSLPPLSYYNKDEEELRPITPPEDRDKNNKRPQKIPERKLIVTGDTDVVLKHLFAGVMEDKNANMTSHLKRGRCVDKIPKRIHVHKSNTKGLLSGDDPYLIDSAISHKLFPQLSLESSMRAGHSGYSSLQLITLREGDKSVTLPSLSIDQNYSQMLTELAMNI